MIIFTLKILNKISPAIVGVRGELIASSINSTFPKFNITGSDAAATIANIVHESGEFTRFEENLNYSVAGLIRTFGRHRISLNQCNAYGRISGVRKANEVAIANCIYGGYYGRRNLGNTLPGDGWNLRGSGGLQLTGRTVLSLFTAYYNKSYNVSMTIYQMAEKLRDKANIDITIYAACWFVKVFKKIKPGTSFIEYVRAINGGLNGLEDRLKYFNKAVTYLK